MTRARFTRYLVPNLGALLVVVLALTGRLGAAGNSTVLGQTATTTTISYQGRLTYAAGQPINATIPIVFKLYGMPTGGIVLWTESRTATNAVPVTNGLFNVLLGSVTPIPVSLLAQNLWLGISVNGDAEMTPREKLASVPYAARAGVAQTVLDGSISTAKLADGAITKPKLGIVLPGLLAHKSCNDCGQSTAELLGGWNPARAGTNEELLEVTVTTHGGPVMVHMTNRFILAAARTHWCGISVLQGETQIRFANLDGDLHVASADRGCSGSYLFADLPAGTYTFRAMNWVPSPVTAIWDHQRQIAVYEF